MWIYPSGRLGWKSLQGFCALKKFSTGKPVSFHQRWVYRRVVIKFILKTVNAEKRLKSLFCPSLSGCKPESLMSTPSSLVRYQELYTAITAGQEEIGSILVYKTFQYSFLKGSSVYSRSHGAFEKKYDSIFSCALVILKQSDRLQFLFRIPNVRFEDTVKFFGVS